MVQDSNCCSHMFSLKMFALMLLKPISSVGLNYKYITISNIYLLYLKISMNFKKQADSVM